MKGDANIVRLLNAQLTMYQHCGLGKLGKKEYDDSIGEMKHADNLINRVLMLEGLPNLQALHKILVGENAPEMLKCDLKLEQLAQKTVKEAIAECELAGDFVSREIFQVILDETEEHIDWIETQRELIDKVGLPNYLQSQMEA